MVLDEEIKVKIMLETDIDYPFELIFGKGR